MQRSKPERASAVDGHASLEDVFASRNFGKPLSDGGSLRVCLCNGRCIWSASRRNRQESFHCHGQRRGRRAFARRRGREHGDRQGAHAERGERGGARANEPRLLEPRIRRVWNGQRRRQQWQRVRHRATGRAIDTDDLVAGWRSRVDDARAARPPPWPTSPREQQQHWHQRLGGTERVGGQSTGHHDDGATGPHDHDHGTAHDHHDDHHPRPSKREAPPGTAIAGRGQAGVAAGRATATASPTVTSSRPAPDLTRPDPARPDRARDLT